MFDVQSIGQEEAIVKWNKLALECKSQLSIAHNPSLFQFYENFLSQKPYFLFLHFNDKVIGLLPLVAIKGIYVSMPHFSGGGILWIKKPDVHLQEADLIMQIVAVINEKKISPGFYKFFINNLILENPTSSIIDIRGTVPLFDQNRTNKATFVLPIKEDEESQFQVFKPNLRRKINKAFKNGVQVKSGKLEFLDDFTHVYNRNMHRIGSPTLGKAFFNALLSSVAESILFVAYLNDKPVGGSFVMWYDGYVENTWFSTLDDFNHLYTSYALHWETIKWAFGQEMRTYSMGRSTIGSGTYTYKLQWPVEEKPLYFSQNSKKKSGLKNQQWATGVWKKLPAFVVDTIGPSIAKRIF